MIHLIITAAFLLLGCAAQQTPLLQPGYDYAQIKTIVLQEVRDFPAAEGSGAVVSGALRDRCKELKLPVTEQAGASPILLVCSISDFNDRRIRQVPLDIRYDEAAAYSGYAQDDAPAGGSRSVTVDREIIRTKELACIDAVVGVKLQLFDTEKNMLLWSSDYAYSGLHHAAALKKCVAAALASLPRLLKR